MKSKKSFLILLPISLLLTYYVYSASPTDSLVNEIEIWPGAGPGSEMLDIKENILVRSLTGNCTRDWAIEKVTVPTITPLLPDSSNGAAVLICPGGAYVRVVYDVEGIGVGEWLNSIGIAAFVLKYRLPGDGHANREYVPLQDAQRAMRYIRKNASKWGLDSTKIGVAGASAGGHVAATLATAYNKVCYEAKDSIDFSSARPDFMFLLYPVISMESDIAHIFSRDQLLGTSPTQEKIDEFSAEKHVTSNTPKTFLALCNDDTGVSPENSKRMYQALLDSGIVSSALHIFNTGGHGRGICKAVGYDFENWPDSCTNWLHAQGLTEAYIEYQPDTTSGSTRYDEHTYDNFTISPNPVTQSSTICFTLEKQSDIEISLYNLTGKKVEVIVNQAYSAGNHAIPFPGLKNESRGLYLVRFRKNNDCFEKKIIY